VDIVLKPAANLQHLDEVLVVTQTSDDLPASAQRDIAKSQAAGAEEMEMQRASDILAEKLPGLQDPNAPAAADSSKATTGPDGVDLRPLKPLTAAHPDRFSPGAVPPASQMTPGKEPVITSSARTNELLNQGAAPKRLKKPISTTGDSAAQETGKSASHTNQESFIIPGTATGPDKPLMGPEKTSAAIVPTATSAGSAIKEQHQ
jgi:rod shape-determining protein MreC